MEVQLRLKTNQVKKADIFFIIYLFIFVLS